VNKLYVGFSKDIALPKGGYLFIDDEVRDVSRSRVFDPMKHCFNPLKGIDYKKARELADVLYTVYPQGENTLTVRNGKRALLRMLLEGHERLDKLPPAEKGDAGALEAMETVGDVLVSPVLRRVLCNPTNFSFNPNSRIFARINRAELGEFDSLVLGLLLMAQFKGQVVVPDGGFYLRDAHASLLRQDRLIVGVNSLNEMPVKLRQMALLIRERVPTGALYEDAVTLAYHAGLRPDPTRENNPFNNFVRAAMA
jgi:hypothetical protein